MEFTIALAGKKILISPLFDATRDFCKDYLAEGKAEIKYNDSYFLVSETEG